MLISNINLKELWFLLSAFFDNFVFYNDAQFLKTCLKVSQSQIKKIIKLIFLSKNLLPLDQCT